MSLILLDQSTTSVLNLNNDLEIERRSAIGKWVSKRPSQSWNLSGHDSPPHMQRKHMQREKSPVGGQGGRGGTCSQMNYLTSKAIFWIDKNFAALDRRKILLLRRYNQIKAELLASKQIFFNPCPILETEREKCMKLEQEVKKSKTQADYIISRGGCATVSGLKSSLLVNDVPKSTMTTKKCNAT